MNNIIMTIVVIVYLCVGVFAAGLIQEDWEKPSIMLMILWPLVLFLFVIFSLIDTAYELGKKLKEKLFK